MNRTRIKRDIPSIKYW